MSRMPIPKDSSLRMPTYVIYYLILSLVIAFLLLSLFIHLPISPDQLFLLFLANAGGYGVVEEITKAKPDSFIRRRKSVLMLALILLIIFVTIVLMVSALDSLLTVVLLTSLDVGVWGILWLVRNRDKKT